jgi:hypothetical protein
LGFGTILTILGFGAILTIFDDFGLFSCLRFCQILRFRVFEGLGSRGICKRDRHIVEDGCLVPEAELSVWSILAIFTEKRQNKGIFGDFRVLSHFWRFCTILGFFDAPEGVPVLETP